MGVAQKSANDYYGAWLTLHSDSKAFKAEKSPEEMTDEEFDKRMAAGLAQAQTDMGDSVSEVFGRLRARNKNQEHEMSKIIVLIGSARKDGNTETLARAFAEGAGQRHDVELVSVADYRIHPCLGCNRCYTSEGHRCFQQDDMVTIYGKLMEADIVVVASPVYFYGISAQLKTLVDRLHTPMRNDFRIRKLGLILVGAATLPDLFDPILLQYRMILRFFHLEDIGTVLVNGSKDKGDVLQGDGLKRAFEMGSALA